MQIIAERLRARAKQLGISNAEAGRRAGFEERRYAHYVSGRRTPTVAALLQICEGLDCTPNWLLGILDDRTAEFTNRELTDRLLKATARMTDDELLIAAVQAEALVARHSK